MSWEAPMGLQSRCHLGLYPCGPLLSESHSVVSNSLQPHKLYTAHGTLQARILEWVAVPFSRRSFQPMDWTQVSCIAGGFFTIWATREARTSPLGMLLPGFPESTWSRRDNQKNFQCVLWSSLECDLPSSLLLRSISHADQPWDIVGGACTGTWMPGDRGQLGAVQRLTTTSNN